MEAHQLRAARALLGMKVVELAELSGVNKNTIVNLELGRRSHSATIEKLQQTLISLGIVFIGEMAPFHKSTVALRYDMDVPRLSGERKDKGEQSDDDEFDTQAWDDVEKREDAQRVKSMQEYMRVHPEEWERLSHMSRKTLKCALGVAPFTS
jgi:transcriptional regulator with XRE-family HTH domain